MTSNFLTDALGSPVAVTDATGMVQTEYTYEPFGRTVVTGAMNSSSYQYTGRENDGTGLYYYRARYYHPGLQRFISEDPILAPLTETQFGCKYQAGSDSRWLLPAMISSPATLSSQLFNQYVYVQNKPLRFTDPSGMLYCEVFCAAVGVAVGGGCIYFHGDISDCVGAGAFAGVLCYVLGCNPDVFPEPPPPSPPSPPSPPAPPAPPSPPGPPSGGGGGPPCSGRKC